MRPDFGPVVPLAPPFTVCDGTLPLDVAVLTMATAVSVPTVPLATNTQYQMSSVDVVILHSLTMHPLALPFTLDSYL